MSAQLTQQSTTECLSAISTLVVKECSVEDILTHIYATCRPFLPFNRIGWAEINPSKDTVTARWSKADTRVLLRCGYTAELKGSSLYFVMKKRKPRIMDDLEKYLENRPDSRSTRLIVKEGIRSSFTCPLFVGEEELGFLFFSSRQPNVYSKLHLPFAIEISNLLSLRLAAVRSQHAGGTIDLAKRLPEQKVIQRKQIPFSDLEPGMVIAESIRCDEHGLLLAAGHELTAHSIDSLCSMSHAGELKQTSVNVDFSQVS